MAEEEGALRLNYAYRGGSYKGSKRISKLLLVEGKEKGVCKGFFPVGGFL